MDIRGHESDLRTVTADRQRIYRMVTYREMAHLLMKANRLVDAFMAQADTPAPQQPGETTGADVLNDPDSPLKDPKLDIVEDAVKHIVNSHKAHVEKLVHEGRDAALYRYLWDMVDIEGMDDDDILKDAADMGWVPSSTVPDMPDGQKR